MDFQDGPNTGLFGSRSDRRYVHGLDIGTTDEFAETQAEPIGYAMESLDRHVSLPTLNGAVVGAVHAYGVREGVLAVACCLAVVTNCSPKPFEEQV